MFTSILKVYHLLRNIKDELTGNRNDFKDSCQKHDSSNMNVTQRMKKSALSIGESENKVTNFYMLQSIMLFANV